MADISLPTFFIRLCEKMENRKISLAPCKCLADEQEQLDILLKQNVSRRETLKREIQYTTIVLEKMQEAYAQSRSMLDAISILEAQQHEPEHENRIAVWLPLTKTAAEKMYEKNNRAQQEKLILQLALLKAEMEVCDNFIKEHSLAEFDHCKV